MNGTPLSVVMAQIKTELKIKITSLRAQVNIPPYIINAVLAEIITELKDEEIEALTGMILESMANREEATEDADTAAQD